jgi:hypothetical protein
MARPQVNSELMTMTFSPLAQKKPLRYRRLEARQERFHSGLQALRDAYGPAISGTFWPQVVDSPFTIAATAPIHARVHPRTSGSPPDGNWFPT